MAKDGYKQEDFGRSLRRVLIGVTLVVLAAMVLMWRVDNPRMERFRMAVVDRVVPNFSWALIPATKAARMIENFQSYNRLYEQNQELRRELQKLKGWRETAVQLEQKNASLLDLNHVKLDPKLTFITALVMADSGSPFRQSVLINVGRSDGIVDGWAAMDGLGLVGRVSGIGDNSARVVLLTDTTSRIPIVVQPSGQRAIMVGDNSSLPQVEFLEEPDKLRPGDRVMTTGDGGVFPSDLLAGQIAIDRDGRLRVRPAADYQRLVFLRILRSREIEAIDDAGDLVAPEEPIAVSEDDSDG